MMAKFNFIRYLIKVYSFFFTLLTILAISFSNISAQTIAVGSQMDEQLQLNLLLQDSLNYGAINRPFTFNFYNVAINRNNNHNKWWQRPIQSSEIEIFSDFSAGLLPISIKNTFNTRIPMGENNAAAWYGRGHTTEFTGGFYIKSEYVSVNFEPHIIYHENKDFLHPRFIQTDAAGNTLYSSEGLRFRYDAPFRFGPDPFSIFNFGNSSIRLHYNKVEAGISSEPLWWGAMRRYPLIMSNNSAGLRHVFLGTREPLNIPYLGKLNARWLGGYPAESDYYQGPEAGRTRFVNFLNIAFSPSIFPNLTIGAINGSYIYQDGGFNISQITYFFNIFDSANRANLEGVDNQDQIASVYFHLVFPEARAEIFAEFAREDFSYDLRDFINQPNHNSAYAFGFQKISDAPYFDFLKTHFELTNITIPHLQQVRFQGNFYTHSQIRQGNTNYGQVQGAAIGPGSNSQFLAIDAYKDNYRVGVFTQRVADNDNFHFERGSASNALSANFGDYFRHRVNLNFGLNFLYGPGPFYINSRLVWTRAYNYGRFDYGQIDGFNEANYDRNDRTNVQFQIGITYIL